MDPAKRADITAIISNGAHSIWTFLSAFANVLARSSSTSVCLTGMTDAWLTICATEMIVAHAANYPSRASEYGPYILEFPAGGARVTPQQLAAAQQLRTAIGAQLTILLDSQNTR
jgi:hypothetical protein